MMAVGSGLVLLVSPDPVETTSQAFDHWLRDAGWDDRQAQLRPPADHETLGYRVCAVDACERPA